jgi:hypothetical protein
MSVERFHKEAVGEVLAKQDARLRALERELAALKAQLGEKRIRIVADENAA